MSPAKARCAIELDADDAGADLRIMSLLGHPRITVDSAISGGRPVVSGTRVRVSDVLDMLAGGASSQNIVADFPYLVAADVQACLAYAARSMERLDTAAA